MNISLSLRNKRLSLFLSSGDDGCRKLHAGTSVQLKHGCYFKRPLDGVKVRRRGIFFLVTLMEDTEGFFFFIWGTSKSNVPFLKWHLQGTTAGRTRGAVVIFSCKY